MKYRKKPIEIEAFQFDGDIMNTKGEWYVPLWAINAYRDGVFFYQDTETNPQELFIKTLEGDMHVSVNDYVIQGVDGELYPCKPEIFEKTYEKVE